MNNWRQARRILCVRLDTLGDVLMTTPALRALKESAPGRELCLLTSTPGSEIARLVPEIDQVLTYDAPWMKATPRRADNTADLAILEALRALHFDGAVIFTVFTQNPLPAALLCYLANIPLRLAYCRENPYQLLTDWILEREPVEAIQHEVRRQLDLVAQIGCATTDEKLGLRVSELAEQRAYDLLVAAGVDLDQPWLVVHPGASAHSRRYPAELYAQVVHDLIAKHGVQVVLTGSRDECALVNLIQDTAQAHSYSLAGALSIAELAAVIEWAPLLVTNNTGPAHIAAAVGTPVIDLYALTNPQHTPWSVPHRVLNYNVPCKYCYKSVCPEGHHNCLRLVSPDQVIQAIGELYGEKKESVCTRWD